MSSLYAAMGATRGDSEMPADDAGSDTEGNSKTRNMILSSTDEEKVETDAAISRSIEQESEEGNLLIMRNSEPLSELEKSTESNRIGNDGWDENIELYAKLQGNTYSIIYVAEPNGWAFFMGIFFFVFQNALAVLAMFELIDWEGRDKTFWEKLKVPKNVSWEVITAAYLTQALAVPLFKDMLDSIESFHEGYYPMVIKQSCNATRRKWFLANFLQLISGLLFEFVIYVLIIQSTTVVGMFLNFAALTFITEVDEVAYSLAARGYFSDSMKKACEDVESIRTPNIKGPWLRRLTLLSFILLAWIGYTNLWVSQRHHNQFMCKKLQVQFGDAYWSDLALYSGVYVLSEGEHMSARPVYRDEMSDGKMSLFRYCGPENFWVFSPRKPEDSLEESLNVACKPENWRSRSPESKSYNILDSSTKEWQTKKASDDDSEVSYPVDHFYMTCLDCNSKTCNQQGGTCHAESNTCMCFPGFTGEKCQFQEAQVCEKLSHDHRFSDFEGDRAFSVVNNKYGGIKYFRGKPVYSHVFQENSAHGMINFLIFNGRRYFYVEAFGWKTNPRFKYETNDSVSDKFVEYLESLLEKGSKLPKNETLPLFVSEPLDVGSSNDKITPTKLAWFFVEKDCQGQSLGVGAPMNSRFLCRNCDDEAGIFCEHGDCENGECRCHTRDFSGSLCEAFTGHKPWDL
jgi:hypothetical protein